MSVHLPACSPVAAHPVKTERHDTDAMAHHTNTGIRHVQAYREHAHGLFVARHFDRHPRIRHWQAQLLPALGVQLCRYDFHQAREHDYYIDIATISQQAKNPAVWEVRDHYLDVIVHEGVTAELVDADELEAAQAAGFISESEVRRAYAAADAVLHGLHLARYHVADWLEAEGVRVEWLESEGVRQAESAEVLS
ncbi:MAG: RNA-binding protein [Deinococcus sp.]|nr:RNA-binding protein [Deinococcus sp.]